MKFFHFRETWKSKIIQSHFLHLFRVNIFENTVTYNSIWIKSTNEDTSNISVVTFMISNRQVIQTKRWERQLSLSEREQNQRADYRLQEETAAALHSSYDQRDPCGEGEQLQVPRCKHLRGPDLDCTHPNTGQESQAKTVPSATAEEIQDLTSYPENFLFRGHRKCTDSVHLSVV